MKILNCTQHKATQDQIDDGVVEPSDLLRESLVSIMTFSEIPSAGDLSDVADLFVATVKHHAPEIRVIMIGGAPFFMAQLEMSCMIGGLKPVYAFSKRESVEKVQPDGSVSKTSVFKHCGFVGLHKV